MHKPKDKNSPTPEIFQENIRTIVQLEEEARKHRSPGERLGDAVVRFMGSLTFILFHALWFAVWMLINTGKIAIAHPFDPPPYMLLSFIVSLEAIFLTSFVLMSQNRMSRQSEHRAHLNLQINLLAEQETTKVLQMLQRICDRLGLEEHAADQEVQQLIERTQPEVLVEELKKNLPNE